MSSAAAEGVQYSSSFRSPPQHQHAIIKSLSLSLWGQHVEYPDVAKMAGGYSHFPMKLE